MLELAPRTHIGNGIFAETNVEFVILAQQPQLEGLGDTHDLALE